MHTALAIDNYRELGELAEYVVVSGAYAGRQCELAEINYLRQLPPDKQATRKAMAYLARTADGKKSVSISPQWAVSIRAIPDVVIEFCSAHHALGTGIEASIPTRSADPLIRSRASRGLFQCQLFGNRTRSRSKQDDRGLAQSSAGGGGQG